LGTVTLAAVKSIIKIDTATILQLYRLFGNAPNF
jgi:hypothetical protein